MGVGCSRTVAVWLRVCVAVLSGFWLWGHLRLWSHLRRDSIINRWPRKIGCGRRRLHFLFWRIVMSVVLTVLFDVLNVVGVRVVVGVAVNLVDKQSHTSNDQGAVGDFVKAGKGR